MLAAALPLIDLRSDTVTKPTTAMRGAIAEAEVGDDVFAEDPTVTRLEARVATLLGKEAALLVPSGTMANQLAIKAHTQPGDEVLVGAGAHNWLFESGAAAVISGVQGTVLGSDGRFTGREVHEAHKAGSNHHFTPTRLLSVENTHNMGGGIVWRREQLDEVLQAAAELGLATHLDGARLWNAAAATGTSEAALAAGFDTVSVCLSKGLGAPVGSLVAGPRRLIETAHRWRKLLGGAMRQAGILAAAGLHALEHHRARLTTDHANARLLAEAAASVSSLSVDLERVHTNIVMVDVAGTADAPAWQAAAAARGVGFLALGAKRFRLVTHLDVSQQDCERAAEVLRQLGRELCG